MLHDSHITTVDPDVEHDAATATVSTSPDVWGEGTQNPFQGWQPDGSLDTPHAVDDDNDVIELELADDIESDQAGVRLGVAGPVVSLLLHAIRILGEYYAALPRNISSWLNEWRLYCAGSNIEGDRIPVQMNRQV
mgnify:CR=1 FL=1